MILKRCLPYNIFRYSGYLRKFELWIELFRTIELLNAEAHGSIWHSKRTHHSPTTPYIHRTFTFPLQIIFDVFIYCNLRACGKGKTVYVRAKSETERIVTQLLKIIQKPATSKNETISRKYKTVLLSLFCGTGSWGRVSWLVGRRSVNTQLLHYTAGSGNYSFV